MLKRDEVSATLDAACNDQGAMVIHRMCRKILPRSILESQSMENRANLSNRDRYIFQLAGPTKSTPTLTHPCSRQLYAAILWRPITFRNCMRFVRVPWGSACEAPHNNAGGLGGGSLANGGSLALGGKGHPRSLTVPPLEGGWGSQQFAKQPGNASTTIGFRD